MELIIIIGVICGFIGYMIDGPRGMILGLLFNLIGLMISAVLQARGS